MKNNYIVGWNLLLVLFLGILIGYGCSSIQFSKNEEDIKNVISSLEQKYFRMEEISYILNKEYYDKDYLSGKESGMIEKATAAFVDGLGDPYTSYLDEKQYSGLQNELIGEDFIEGIGAVVGKKDYYIQVEEIVKGSPSYKAGLQPLDRIVMIGTGETQDLTVTEAVKRIRGPKGTTVELFIERLDKNGKKEYFQVNIERDVIDIPSVKTKVIEKNGIKIGYIEIYSFGEQTNKLFTHAISEILMEKVKGVIIDVRGNGGGLLTSAVQLAGHFIPSGELIVKSKYKTYQDTDYLSKGFGELEKMPTVILINGITASSSEIFALALKEKVGATIVGKKSYGKGTIQTLFDFKDGTSLKFTIGKRFSPNGVSIDGEGITPDIEESIDITGYVENGIDSQLEKAKQVLFEKIN